MNIKSIIEKDIKNSLIKIGFLKNYKLLIKSSKKITKSHYQLNNLIQISKIFKINSETLAEKIIFFMNKKNIYKKIVFSKPGFINISLNPDWLSKKLENIFTSSRFGINHVKTKNIIIDYSSPNIAKEMHIGHLRSTIIGDVTARSLNFLGHNVIRANHIGDWGTQFGMLIAYLEYKNLYIQLKKHNISLMQLEKLYCKAKKKYDNDILFAKKSRIYISKLQHGDVFLKNIWKKIVSITMSHNQYIYKRLNVTLNNTHIMGESLYKNMLPDIIKDLKQKKIAIEKNGEVIVYLKDYKNRLGEPLGIIIQKKDKSFLYSTIDIACIKYRYQTLNADRIIYYTDSRQSQHLIQAWKIAKLAQYIPDNFVLEHHMFGMMLSEKKRPFKTRDGNTIKLSALLNEATERAMKIIHTKKPNISKKKCIKLAEIIGISAVKYSDLSKNRNTNYIFNWDTMLNFEGNTSLYIQYAYTRIISILKKSKMSINKIKNHIILKEESEISLAIKLLEFEEIIIIISQKGTPHIMCQYLYQVATYFSSFYTTCSILFPKRIKIQKSRLKLSFLTAKIIKKGLNILGIKITKKM